MIRHIPNADQVIRETLDYVGLSDTGKKVFRDFSLGMKQRLWYCHCPPIQTRLPNLR